VKPHPNWPFEAWLKIAVMQLGLSPAQFWAISLIDWFSLTRPSGPPAMTKSDLIKMEDRYANR